MRKRIALSAVSVGMLMACGPVSVDLGGGGQAGSAGSDTTGVGGGLATGGRGGAYPGGVGGTGGSPDQYCGDGVIQYPETCDDPSGVECPGDCGIESGIGGRFATGGVGGTGGSPDQFCGDGVVQYPEECDDPRGLEGTCTPDCLLRPDVGGAGGTYGRAGAGGTGGSPDQYCGDGVVQYPEECDDPRGVEGTCTPECRIRPDVGGTGGVGGAYGAAGSGGGYGTAGSGGAYAAGGSAGDLSCVAELVGATGDCADNDVLLGQAYERCMQLGRSLAGVRFNSPCDDYASRSIEIECCARADGAAGSSAE
jgi:hypothetical protein